MESFQCYTTWILLVLISIIPTEQVLLSRSWMNEKRDTESICVQAVGRSSRQLNCKLTFRENAGVPFDANCVKKNVLSVPYNRPSVVSQRLQTSGADQLVNEESILPPYARFTCSAPFFIDFEFQGNGGLGLFRIWKSVSYVDGTSTFKDQVLNLELLLSPEATGRFIFHRMENASIGASFFIFAERPAGGPYLIGGGERKTIAGHIASDGTYILPCIPSNPDITVDLYELTQNTWFLRVGDSKDVSLGFTPEVGFRINVDTLSRNSSERIFQCRVGEYSGGDFLNVTIPLMNSTVVQDRSDKQLLKIEVGDGAICISPDPDNHLKLYNVYVRNPTESKIISKCLLKGIRNCGDDRVYHKRVEGIQGDGALCSANGTPPASCAIISPTQLHKEGVIVCVGKTQSARVEYFTGFDGKIYTDVTEAPTSALLRVTWTTSSNSVQLKLNSTTLFTGIKYEIKCKAVEFPFIKEAQLLYVKYKNGTEKLLADLVWWKAGKELYMSPEMIGLECRDRLWTTNELYNSSVRITVIDKECSGNQFKCASSQCIKDIWRCDGDKDCMDGTDEEDCHIHVCKPGFFKCLSGQCISLEKRCNNKRECPDGSDESENTCRNLTCSLDQFKCESGQCILAPFICDGDGDCFDGSDESPKNCAQYFPVISNRNQNVTFISGSPALLICHTAAIKPPKLKPWMEWWRNDSNVTDASLLWRNSDISKLGLWFPNVSVLDAGEYTCFAQNSLSRSSLKFNIEVQMPDSDQIQADSGTSIPCHDDDDEDHCLERICAVYQVLSFCRDRMRESGLPAMNALNVEPEEPSGTSQLWLVMVGGLILTALVVAVFFLVWKRYFNSNLLIHGRGAVRLTSDDEVYFARS